MVKYLAKLEGHITRNSFVIGTEHSSYLPHAYNKSFPNSGNLRLNCAIQNILTISKINVGFKDVLLLTEMTVGNY
ncbi:hypothetical protein CLQ_20136 [Clostridium botulinum Af84]|nr:hypothetical protein CLQ_20136 [Clostridium botulinum Af84]OSA83039.1 hypothetical protein B2H84_04385 [Clostridium botulinum]